MTTDTEYVVHVAEVEALRAEARYANDWTQAGICAVALGLAPTATEIDALAEDGWAGNQQDALDECVGVILDARAQA